MSNKPDLSDYIEVSERIQHFREAFPEGSLQSEVVSMTDSLVVVRAFAYRNEDDKRPGVGLASEPIPGRTPYTKDSELMNAETSAWGRAIIAVGASDAKRVASANEVRNRQAPAQTTGDKIRAAAKQHGLIDEVRAFLAVEHDTDRVDALSDPAQSRLLGLLETPDGREYLTKAAQDA